MSSGRHRAWSSRPAAACRRERRPNTRCQRRLSAPGHPLSTSGTTPPRRLTRRPFAEIAACRPPSMLANPLARCSQLRKDVPSGVRLRDVSRRPEYVTGVEAEDVRVVAHVRPARSPPDPVSTVELGIRSSGRGPAAYPSPGRSPAALRLRANAGASACACLRSGGTFTGSALVRSRTAVTGSAACADPRARRAERRRSRPRARA